MSQTIDDPQEAIPVDDTYERLFLVGVFAFMAAALFIYVWKFRRNVPFWVDWELVRVLTGCTPVSLAWLWTPHNEHSIPIVRLVVYGLWRHADRLYPIPATFAERLELLRIARAGPYASPQAFPGESPCGEVVLPVRKLGEDQIFVDGSTFRAVGNDPFVVYALPASRYVCGVRLRYTLTNASLEAPAMQMFWANPSDEEFREGRRSTSVAVERTTEVQESTVRIYGTVYRLRIDPDQQPSTFELHEITFLVRDQPR